VYTHNPKLVVLVGLAIGHVLLMCGVTKIANAIIQNVAILVIYSVGEVAMPKQEYHPVNFLVLALQTSKQITPISQGANILTGETAIEVL